MTPKNIDETIKKLLYAYAKHCATVLAQDEKNIKKRKYENEEYRKQDEMSLAKAKQAYNFLLKIAQNPKNYLYSGKDIYRTNLPDGTFLWERLLPIMGLRFDPSNDYLLLRLSEQIAQHVKCTPNKPDEIWEYCEEFDDVDISAELIINMNKKVQLWNSNNFSAVFKGLLPASVFAVDWSHKER